MEAATKVVVGVKQQICLLFDLVSSCGMSCIVRSPTGFVCCCVLVLVLWWWRQDCEEWSQEFLGAGVNMQDIGEGHGGHQYLPYTRTYNFPG